jgi:ATP-binding cassette subfamily B protein
MEVSDAFRLLTADTLISSMPESIRRELWGKATVRSVRAGARVCMQGQPANELLIPLDGHVRLSFRTPDGSTRILGSLAPRRALNLRRLLRGEGWDYMGTAEAKLHLFAIPAAQLIEAISIAPNYRAYLEKITEYRCLRSAMHELKRLGASERSLQSLFAEVTPQETQAGDLLAGRGARPAWIIVDDGDYEVGVEHQGQLHALTTLQSGEYYGGSHLLADRPSLAIRCVRPGRVFMLPAARIAHHVREAPDLRDALKADSASLIKRARPAMLELGLEWAHVLAVPQEVIEQRAQEGQATGTSVPSRKIEYASSTSVRAIRARRMDGIRCSSAEESAVACVASVAKFFGVQSSTEALSGRLTRRPLPSLVDVAVALEEHGLVCHAAKVDAAKLRELETPAIMVVDQHYVVLHEVNRRSVVVFDPIVGLIEIDIDQLASHFGGNVLLVRCENAFYDAVKWEMDQQKEGKKLSLLGPRLRVLRLITDAYGIMGWILVVSLALVLVGLISPYLNGVVVDTALVHHDFSLLDTIALGLVLVNVSTFMLTGIKAYLISHVSRILDYRLSTLFYRHALGVASAFHAKDRVGAMVARLGELDRIREMISTEAIEFIVQMVTALVYSGWLFYYSWKLAIIPILAAPVAFIISRVGGARYRKLYTAVFDNLSKTQSRTTEQMEAIAAIKAVSGEHASRMRWEQSFVDGILLRWRLLGTASWMGASTGTLEETARIAGLYFAVSLVFSKELSPGAVLAVSQYLNAALKPLLNLASYLDHLQQLAISFDKLDEVFREPLEISALTATQPEPEFEGRLRLDRVSFRYTPDGPYVLRDVSFEVAAGQVIAIVGRSGSGKTTLAKLIQGAVRPNEGKIFYDDSDGQDLPLTTIRKNVGIVMQDSQLVAGTIADNIAYCDDRPELDRVRQAARAAAADEFISALPGGYETYLAEGGLGLSGGQRQRISIARTLYRDPSILVLDEATSALDTESERRILAQMHEILHGRTALIIAHRLNTVKNADLVVVIDKGAIVEVGTHMELVSKRGVYFGLFAQQFRQS